MIGLPFQTETLRQHNSDAGQTDGPHGSTTQPAFGPSPAQLFIFGFVYCIN